MRGIGIFAVVSIEARHGRRFQRHWLRATIDFAAVDAPGDPFEALQIPIWYLLASVAWKARYCLSG